MDKTRLFRIVLGLSGCSVQGEGRMGFFRLSAWQAPAVNNASNNGSEGKGNL